MTATLETVGTGTTDPTTGGSGPLAASRRAGQPHVGGQTQLLHQPDVQPGEVDLTPEAVARGMGEGMVVVVPALTEGERGHPGVVARPVAALVADLAPGVGGGIHQPGDVVHHHQAQGDPPQHQGPAAGAAHRAQPEEKQPEHHLKGEEPIVQPAVVGIAGQIPREPRHRLQRWNLLEHPEHVAPPEALVAVVMIGVRIGKLVVMAVQPHPVNRSVLAAQGAAGGEEPLQPEGHPESPVAEHAVVANRHPQAGRHPIEHQQRHHRLPAPELGQQGEHRQAMHHGHEREDPCIVRLVRDEGDALVVG